MPISDLSFSVASATVNDPLSLTAVATTVTVTNNGADTLTNVGFYLIPSTWSGDVARPPSASPETDYQDLLTWGQAVLDGGDTQGGVKLTCIDPSATTTFDNYIGRASGADYSTRVGSMTIAPGESATVNMLMEAPTALGAARNVYADIKAG